MPTLAILVHADDTLQSNYLLLVLTEIWRRWGVTIEIVHGPHRFVPADVACLHVDLTRVPRPYLRLLAHYDRRINAGAIDIGKRRLTDRRVCTPVYRGPVIVKSNRNHGGRPERDKARGIGSRLAQIGDRLPWWVRGRFPNSEYPIFASARAVPWPVWLNPRLIVERLICEREGERYCVRRWIFFGSREVSFAHIGTAPHVTRDNRLERRVVDTVPEELRAWRRRLGFDFGKFDYAIVDGRTVLYDVNRTPNLRMFREPWFAPHLADLAEGLWEFLPRP